MAEPTDNTEGSLTKEQEEILVGVLLGDGTMRKKTNALLEINHSIRQRQLVDWLYLKFNNFVSTAPKMRKGNGKRVAYRFTTKSLPIMNSYYNMFFFNRKKVIPNNFLISPLSLAIWYMDDGSRCGEDIYLNTQQFSQEEQRKLSELLKVQYNIDSNLNKDKIYWRIRLKKASTPRFMGLIRQYILPSFQYKLLSAV